MQRQAFTPIALALSAVLVLSACASKPKPGVVDEAPMQGAAQQQDSASLPSLDQTLAERSLQQDLAVNAGDRVFFDLDSHILTNDARDTLARQARWLNEHPGVRVMVAGNCDERGTREYNFALGARRASSARDFLVSQGVSGGRIATVSYGKERPIDGGADEQAWSRNRNAGTVVIDLAPL